MILPGRTLRYVGELQRRGLIRGTLRSMMSDLRRFGIGGHARYALELAGAESLMEIEYPGSNSRFKVRVTPFWQYWRALEAGTQDSGNLRFLASWVKPGQTVLDVGAWEGPYTLLLSELVGQRGQVHAFEPDPRALAVLRDNVRKNRLDNVHVEGSTLSNVEGDGLFYDAAGGTIGTLVPNYLVSGMPPHLVRTTTIDRYCRDREIVVDGMKVDVEGAEALVLDGARETLERCSPWVFLEFHGVFMPRTERVATWQRIVEDAHEVIFVTGESERYRPGDRMESYPECDYFHALIRY